MNENRAAPIAAAGTAMSRPSERSVSGLPGDPAGQLQPEPVHRRIDLGAGAEAIDLLALELQPPVVGRPVERHDLDLRP